MNILLVNTFHHRGGGDSTYTFNLAEILRNKGHQVSFFAMQDSRNLPDPNSDLFVSHIDFQYLNRNKGLISGISVLGRAIYSIEAQRKFSLLLNRIKPDIVHLQNIHAHITPSVIIEAKKKNLPVVWTLHDFKLICPNTHFSVDSTGQICEACGRSAYYRALLLKCKKGSSMASGMAALEAYIHNILKIRNRVDAFLTPSQFLRNKILAQGFQPNKVHHLPYLLPETIFRNVDSDEGYILFFGRLDPIKGIRPLLEAVTQVPRVKLVLAGRIDQVFEMEFLQLLPPNGTYVGMQQGEDLWQIVMGARAIVVPSLWYENQPFSILEAFAFGKPVIASNLGGMTELVKDRERGILVPPGNIEALVTAIRWMNDHPQEVCKMGQAAHRYVLEEHNSDRHYQILMNIYNSVLDKSAVKVKTQNRVNSAP